MYNSGSKCKRSFILVLKFSEKRRKQEEGQKMEKETWNENGNALKAAAQRVADRAVEARETRALADERENHVHVHRHRRLCPLRVHALQHALHLCLVLPQLLRASRTPDAARALPHAS